MLFCFFEFVAPVSTAKLTLLRCDKSNGNSALPSENVKHVETQQSHLKNSKTKEQQIGNIVPALAEKLLAICYVLITICT